MPASVNIDVKVLQAFQRSMERRVKSLWGTDMLQGMRNVTMAVSREAKINAPVDTGRLRASILPDVITPDEHRVVGVVGSNVEYAPFMEFGTRPHWPPIAALQVWAERHGTSAFLVARAIAQRGLAPRRFLQNAFDRVKDQVGPIISGVFSKAFKDVKDEVER